MTDFDTLVRLADDLYSRFEREGNPSDLSLCIVRYRSALTLASSSTNLSSDARSKLFSNLANALSIRFQRHGDIADLDHSVDCHVTALDLRPLGHPGRAKTLSNFAAVLLVRYSQLGMQKDIELAIEYFNSALSILPPDARLMPLMNYASALFSRFQRAGDVSDLNDAIHQYRAVVDSSPSENKYMPYYNLANALLSRFKLENDPKDLELSIEYSSTALQGMNKGHPDYLLTLCCLSNALIRRFELYGNAKDLQTAVENFKSVLELRSTEDVLQYTAFNDLADALATRYRSLSDLADLELAIQHYRTALEIADSSHKNEGTILDNMGNALFLRFSRLGSLDDLEEAIQKHFCALDIQSNLPRRVITLEALGTCLDARFEQFGDPEDLHTAIDLCNEALIETSQDHPHRATILTKSASSLQKRFRSYGEIVDLDRSISYCREALELLAPDHPDQATSYLVLVSSLLQRFEETGDEFDLDEAYFYCSTSANMQHTSDPLQPSCHLLLARVLRARVLPWDVKDTKSIFRHLRFAKDLCTLTHPLISDIYAELASTYYLRFLLEQRPSDIHDTFGLHELSINVAGSALWPAFRASLQCIKDAETYGHRSGIDVYRGALRLVDRQILAARSPQLRQCLARRYCSDLACGAASFALRFQDLEGAVEALEDGRSLLWSQLVRAKTCLDELRLRGEYAASLADNFARLSFQLERVSRSSKDVKPLLKEKDAVVEQIRRLEGLKSFLKSTPFYDLEKAAVDGPVIILNASQNACDALIVLNNISPIHVPLLYTTPRDVSQMAARFRELSRKNPMTDEDEEALEHLLSKLWDVVVFPIIQHLIPRTLRGSRLWWCPTGVFTRIPLHAAGPYRGSEPRLSQVYVSSYTPTLQALIRAKTATHEVPRSRSSSMIPGFLKSKRSKQTLTSQTTPTIVAIGHATSDETCQQLELLRNRIPPCMPFRRMEGEEVSSNAVLAAFREPVWLHLACPLSLDSKLPCYSGFATRDGVLSLCDISKARPRVEFAFLSGQCGRADDSGLEEAMHLVASLQYSGIRSVIGTLWPVDDEVMRRVTVAFYEKIIPITRERESMHFTHIAQSLNNALETLGRVVPLTQRIAFVHVGA